MADVRHPREVTVVLLALVVLLGGCDALDAAPDRSVATGPEQADASGVPADAGDGGRGPAPGAFEPAPMTMGDASALVLQTGEEAVEDAVEEAGGDSVTFTDVGAELGYVHQLPARYQEALTLFEAAAEEPVTTMEAAQWPADPYGAAGVAIVDLDGDGDLDIYVANGAGAPNGLYLNQLTESGQLGFVEAAEAAGVTATESESTGVCAGDVDNDGDTDLMVVGNPGPMLLFLNDGTGVFTPAPGMPAQPTVGGSTCAMGDVNGDGLLDIAVGRTFDHTTTVALVAEPFALSLHNLLLIQQPDGSFVDEGEERGIRRLRGVPEGAAGISWGVSLVDYDTDGDLDLITSDDQAVIPSSRYGGIDRGLLQVFENDGTGNFTAIDAGTLTPGPWMGTAFADFDCDGNLDMFGANFGDYGFPTLGNPYTLGDYSSRWLLGDGNGGFTDPGVGDLGATHFAWGGVAEDFDNDGDADIIFQGGVDLGLLVDLSNPGTFLTNNGCTADFTWQRQTFDVNHLARVVSGTAAGDLDGDGFVDVVTVSSLDVPDSFPVFPMPAEYGVEADGTGFFAGRFMPTDDGRFTYLGQEFAPGTLTVEINSGNDNRGIAVRPVGAFGLTDGAIVPRSAFGAIVTVTPDGGQSFTKPLQGGGGYLSADSPIINAGLGDARAATVDILWPGGVRNRFYDVATGSTLVAPEIPCSYLDRTQSATEYTICVSGALAELAAAGVIDAVAADAFLADALRAREER